MKIRWWMATCLLVGFGLLMNAGCGGASVDLPTEEANDVLEDEAEMGMDDLTTSPEEEGGAAESVAPAEGEKAAEGEE